MQYVLIETFSFCLPSIRDVCAVTMPLEPEGVNVLLKNPSGSEVSSNRTGLYEVLWRQKCWCMFLMATYNGGAISLMEDPSGLSPMCVVFVHIQKEWQKSFPIFKQLWLSMSWLSTQKCHKTFGTQSSQVKCWKRGDGRGFRKCLMVWQGCHLKHSSILTYIIVQSNASISNGE